MKRIFTILVPLFAVLAGIAQKTKTVTITGLVSGDTKGHDYIIYYSGGSPVDSVPIKNGKFVLAIPFTETFTQILVTQYSKSGNRTYRPFPLLIDGSGDIKIELDIVKGFFEANISGSKTAVAFNSFLKSQNESYKKISEGVTAIFGKSYVPESDPLAKMISNARDLLTKIYMGAVVNEFVEKHKNEYVGVYVLNTAGKGAMDIDKLEKTLQSLSPAMQKSAEGEKLTAYIRGLRNASVGSTIKNFVLNDPEGKAVSFAQFKGKYVWIDFWASWCGPCKQAFPHMKELYAQYKDKGFEILGISTDTKIDPWLKILPTLQNPWPQVWDNKNVMSEFAVTAFPTSFLIDPDGKIVLKEIGYEPNGESAMDKKLEELFGKAITTKENNQEKVQKGEPIMKATPIIKN